MTLVAAFKVGDTPVLLGDLLITVDDDETGSRPVDGRRKLLQITDQLVVGWTGWEDRAKEVLGALYARRAEMTSLEALQAVLAEPPTGDLPVEAQLELAGWFGPETCFSWNVDDPETFCVDESHYIGSGWYEARYWGTLATTIGVKRDRDPLAVALEGPCRLMAEEMLDTFSQRILGFGYCYEVLYWSGERFEALSEVLYEVCTCIIGNDGAVTQVQLHLPAVKMYATHSRVVVSVSEPPRPRAYQVVEPIAGSEGAGVAAEAEAVARMADEQPSLPAYRCVMFRLAGPDGIVPFTVVFGRYQEPWNLGTLVRGEDGEQRFAADYNGAAIVYERLIASREAGYRRSAAAGSDSDTVLLSQLLERRGDRSEAAALLLQADEAGSALAAAALGSFLEQNGALDLAESAYRRSDERGDGTGSSLLGLRLRKRGDLDKAIEAFKRADERGDAQGANNLGVALEEIGDEEGSRAAFERADARGDFMGTRNLARVLGKEGKLRAANAAFLKAKRQLAELPPDLTNAMYRPRDLPRPKSKES